MKIVEWQEQITQSGIQLGGLSSVTKRGEMLSTHAYPAMDAAGRQGIVTIVVVRVFENGQIIGMPAEMCRYVPDQLTSGNGQYCEPLSKSE